uniref:Secreted protein n=1 Tax=Pyxicephalus adspersus TaxID=30357 RepID=A0AAV3AR78_PYXAD|nr:TPA: hypothetical protein GDO54_008270 [Pyxicephalus adspersus]
MQSYKAFHMCSTLLHATFVYCLLLLRLLRRMNIYTMHSHRILNSMLALWITTGVIGPPNNQSQPGEKKWKKYIPNDQFNVAIIFF